MPLAVPWRQLQLAAHPFDRAPDLGDLLLVGDGLVAAKGEEVLEPPQLRVQDFVARRFGGLTSPGFDPGAVGHGATLALLAAGYSCLTEAFTTSAARAALTSSGGSRSLARRLLRLALHGDEPHGRPLGGFADCLGVGVVLLPLDERLQSVTHIRHSGLFQNFRPTSLSISPAVTTDGSHLFRPRGLHFGVASFPAIHVVNQKLFSPALTYVYLQLRWNIRAALTL